jgi:hypothetical protein
MGYGASRCVLQGTSGKCCMMRVVAAHKAAASKLVQVMVWSGEWMLE